ncbi:MAG: sigma-54-dependent Fis family transcriptional regulator [Candidatus Omnitrophica bacterium]|nr:sigma-54-dependent Fis family transcriptional regulator [Candidatus Omnitrophota bacterium]
MKHEVLVVDDDAKIANMICVRMKKQGYEVSSVAVGKEALQWVEHHHPVLILLDVRLPDISGVEVLQEVLKRRPEIYIIMISAHADVQIAVECIKHGACDFLEKPFELEAFDAKVNQIFKRIVLEEQVAELKKELGASYKFKSLVGSSPAMRKVFHAIDLAAKSEVNVLIEGESGTGKELVARAIHAASAQKEGAFVAVNCGAIPDNLLESELFGHEKGAFTGAVARKIGKFEQASGGTIFLDEISELPLALQVKFLRVLQEREVERVGGSGAIPVQVRVMAATNQDLKTMLREGKFREDLYYRLNVFPIPIPPLRERKSDIHELFIHFVNKHRNGKVPVKTDEYALKQLEEYAWPGNVRELENFVERLILLLGDRKLITEKDIHSLNGMEKRNKVEVPATEDRKKTLGETEKVILQKALEDAQGNVTHAARLVQMSRDTFYRKMKKYKMQDFPSYRRHAHLN